MSKRFLFLFGLVLLIGFATKAFAESPVNLAGTTRAGAVALLIESDPVLKERLQHFIDHRPPMPLFSDVDYTQWYAPYVEVAFEAGLISGNANGQFRPGAMISEEEAIVLSVRYHARTNSDLRSAIADPGSDWFTTYAASALKFGLDLPFPIKLGQPMNKTNFYALVQSAGVKSPAAIVISHTTSKPVEVVQAPIQPIRRTPIVTQATSPQQRRITSIRQQPVTQRPSNVVAQLPSQPVTQTPSQPSSKSFAISMPTLGIKDLTITHPSDPFTKNGLLAVLQYGVGHLFSYPGKGGKILIYGHSSSYAWDVSQYTKIFRQINKLNIGDTIEVTYNDTLYTYQVTNKQTVPADDMSVYQQGGGEELILYTCWPPDSIKERYLVHAKPIAQVALK